MKKALLFFAGIGMMVTLMAQEEKEVVTGASYADDVYYSLENGTVTTVARNNWDLGFTASGRRASVSANHPEGVEVYTYSKGDISSWETVDTSGMVLEQMYNSLSTLTNGGAFVANYTTFPDNGWGVYNFNTHNVTGDSLFIVKTRSGEYKKLAIITKSSSNSWEFKYAGLDGSNEQTVTVNANDYKSKNFFYYALDTGEIVDREPVSADWDLLFTKYIKMIFMGPTPVPYPVTGVLNNESHILAQEVKEEGLAQATFLDYEEANFTDTVNIIGSDWKSFNMDTYSYDLDSTVVYFLKKYVNKDSVTQKYQDSIYYKIYFTGFTGTSEGKYTFMQELLSVVSASNPLHSKVMELYPNPARDHLNLAFDHVGTTEMQIIDLTGKLVQHTRYQAGGFSRIELDVSKLQRGIYLLKIDTKEQTEVLRFIKE